MNLIVRLYDAEGFQDDGAEMPVSFIEVEITGSVLWAEGEEPRHFELTVGRLFFDKERLQKMIGDPPLNVIVNDLRKRPIEELL